jgi:hypothetical protein
MNSKSGEHKEATPQTCAKGVYLHSATSDNRSKSQTNGSDRKFVKRRSIDHEMGYSKEMANGSRLVLKAEATRSRAAVGERILALVDVSGWADRNVFVERRLLFVPRDAHPRALGEN